MNANIPPAMSTVPPLHDIHGLDHISFWPLPLSAWVILVLVTIIFGVIGIWFWKRAHRLPTWEKQILAKLGELDSKLDPQNSRTTALELSQILRRLAIHRFGREACAGLEGEAWLNWLTEHDRKQFQWNKVSAFLVTAPYAPMDSKIEMPPIRETIAALKGWVK